MTTERFFSRSNIYRTLWSVIVCMLAFAGGLIWQGFNGPEKVVIINKGEARDTIVTIIHFIPDKAYFENLNSITVKSVRKRHARNHSDRNLNTIDSLSLVIANDYQIKFDSLHDFISSDYHANVKSKIASTPNLTSNEHRTNLQRPLFTLPSNIKGYTDVKPNAYAAVSINSLKFLQNEMIKLTVDLFNEATLNKITPLFIEILEPESDHSAYLLWSEQYGLTDLNNVISFSADFKPGKYVLSMGFYLKEELNRKFPMRLNRKFNIEIVLNK